MQIGKGVPPRMVDRAATRLALYKAGKVHARRLRNGKALVIDLGLRHRLVKVGRRPWRVVHHGEYSTLIERL